MNVSSAAAYSVAAYSQNTGTRQSGSTFSASSVSSVKTDLTKEEQQYDADSDGTLSAVERSAMLAARKQANTRESAARIKVSEANSAASLEISQAGYDMFMLSKQSGDAA
jgi:hypothetical protein